MKQQLYQLKVIIFTVNIVFSLSLSASPIYNSFSFFSLMKKEKGEGKTPASQLRANAYLFWILNVSQDTEMG